MTCSLFVSEIRREVMHPPLQLLLQGKRHDSRRKETIIMKIETHATTTAARASTQTLVSMASSALSPMKLFANTISSFTSKPQTSFNPNPCHP